MKFINKELFSKYLPQIIAPLFILAFAVFAWQEPSQTPPGGNVRTLANQPTRSAPARALQTIYQNTTGKPILVLATLFLFPYHGEYAAGRLMIGSASPPNTAVSQAGRSLIENFEENWQTTLVGLVPNNWYYEIVVGMGPMSRVTLNHWEEITW